MKRIIFSIICIFFLTSNTEADDYAILVSAGIATTDDVFSNSEYWYDIFLAYEDLVLNEGYDAANVFVFYGNGASFNSTRARYQLALHGWGNSATTATTHSTAVTGRDPINADDYWVLLQNRNLCVRETEIIRIINQIPNYKRRKIVWMTCHSGCLAGGTNNLNNNSTVLITSSRWDQVSFGYNLPGETIHAELNYITTSALFGEDPISTAFNADDNGDNVINMWELWNEADINSIMTSDPQIRNIGNLADMIYIDEHLVIENINFVNDIEYLVEDYKLLNSSIQTGADIEVDIDNSFEINGMFEIPVGSTLDIHP